MPEAGHERVSGVEKEMPLNITGAAVEAVREAEVRKHLGLLRHHTEILYEKALVVLDRFEFGMRVREPDKVGEDKKVELLSCPLAVELRDISTVLLDVDDILQDLLNRCEL